MASTLPNPVPAAQNRTRSRRLARSAKRTYNDIEDDEFEPAYEISPGKSRPWTEEEDSRLRNAIKRYGEHAWTKMSKNDFASLRNAQQCRQRWSKVLRPGIKKGAWSYNEDTILTAAVKRALQMDECDFSATGDLKIQWNSVADNVPNRTYAMCRERWKNHLDPSINHSDFSKEEQARLQQLYNEYGNKYSNIARQMPGRTSEKVKAWARARKRTKLSVDQKFPVTPASPKFSPVENIISSSGLPVVLPVASTGGPCVKTEGYEWKSALACKPLDAGPFFKLDESTAVALDCLEDLLDLETQ